MLESDNQLPFPNKEVAIVKGPYLVRSIRRDGDTLGIRSELNATVPFKVISSSEVEKVTWSGAAVDAKRTDQGTLVGFLEFNSPEPQLPGLAKLE